MPIYDYACATCRHRLEVFHGINESGPRQCPVCGGQASRAFAPPTILFKGSGWAKVDRRSASATSRRAGSEPSDGDSGSGSEPSDGDSGSGSEPSTTSTAKEAPNSATSGPSSPGSGD